LIGESRARKKIRRRFAILSSIGAGRERLPTITGKLHA
jgi:hypothetical protein